MPVSYPLSFSDNFIHPITLPAGEEYVDAQLDLPNGHYLLTVTDSSDNPSRYEIIDVIMIGGTADIWRPHMPPDDAGWPEGSFVFCSVNAAVLERIFSEIDLAYQAIDDSREGINRELGGPKYFFGGGGYLQRSTGLLFADTSSVTRTLRVSDALEHGRVDDSTVITTLGPNGSLRIQSDHFPIAEARMQNYPGLSFELSADRTYVDISPTVPETQHIRIRILTWIGYSPEHGDSDGSACFILTSFEDLAGFSLLS